MSFLFNPCQPCCISELINFCGCSGVPSPLCVTYTEGSGYFYNIFENDSYNVSKIVGARAKLFFDGSQMTDSGVGFNQCGINDDPYLDFNFIQSELSCTGDGLRLRFLSDAATLETEAHIDCGPPFVATGTIYSYFIGDASGYLKFSARGQCNHGDFCGLNTRNNLYVYNKHQEQAAALVYNNETGYYEGQTPSGFLQVECHSLGGDVGIDFPDDNVWTNQFRYSLNSGEFVQSFYETKEIRPGAPYGFSTDLGAEAVNYFGNYVTRDEYEMITPLYTGTYFDTEPIFILSNMGSDIIEPNKHFVPFCKKSLPKTLFANVNFNGSNGKAFSGSVEMNFDRLSSFLNGRSFVGWSGFFATVDMYSNETYHNLYLYRRRANILSPCFGATVKYYETSIPLREETLAVGIVLCGGGETDPLTEGQSYVGGAFTLDFISCNPFMYSMSAVGAESNTINCSGTYTIVITE